MYEYDFTSWNDGRFPKYLGRIPFQFNDIIVGMLTIGTIFNPVALPLVFIGSSALYSKYYGY